MASHLRRLWSIREALILILTPIVLLPVPILYNSAAGRCAYGLLIMAVYWMTEPIPMEVTALLPVVMFPLLGVATSKELSGLYLKDSNMLFLGGFMVVVAIEKWDLHRRIALRALLMVGSKPHWLMFGFMVTTAFLSMWISNTATTAMMCPIAHAVLVQLRAVYGRPQERAEGAEEERAQSEKEQDSLREVILMSDSRDLSLDSPREGATTTSGPVYTQMCVGIMLSVCYSANIGGIATLIGTGPNLVNQGLVDSLFGDAARLNFTSWFIFACPVAVLCLALAWFWLQWMYLPSSVFRSCRTRRSKEPDNGARRIIQQEYNKLPPISWAEKSVLVSFVVMVLLWFTRQPDFVPGWAKLFRPGYVSDTTVSVCVGVLLFMLPAARPSWDDSQTKVIIPCSDTVFPGRKPSRILDWTSVQHNLNWGVLVIRGGGFALAAACKVSGLSSDVSAVAAVLIGIRPWLLLILVTVIVAAITEFVSNVATSAIFLPIVAEMALSIGVNPLYLMLAVTVATSFSFMLPVATAPNTIVFSYGYVTLGDMVKSGVAMNAVCLLALHVIMNTWGYYYFDLGTFPDWAQDAVTSHANVTVPGGVINGTHYIL